MGPYPNDLIAVLLVSLRIAPTLAFAPPFSLLRIPAIVRVILSFGLAGWIVVAGQLQNDSGWADAGLASAMLAELLMGVVLALALQLAFAAILMAGRTLDFQVGFGLAVLADPTFRAQTPLVGTLFAYAAAAVFFATEGPADLLAIWAQSLERFPIGAYAIGSDLSPLLSYTGAVFSIALGIAGFVMLTIFLVDIAVALLSRTLPQMNVLVLGFQVKTIALLATLPLVFTFSGAVFLRLVRLAIDATPRLL